MINIDDRLISLHDGDELKLLLTIAKRINVDRTAWPSLNTLSEETKWGKPKVIAVTKRLCKKGVLSVEKKVMRNGANASNVYRVLTDGIGIYMGLNKAVTSSNETLPPLVTDCYHPSNETLPEVLTNEVLRKDIVGQAPTTPPKKELVSLIPFGDIVTYLNEQTGRNFKATSKATQSHITARWREGWRLDDFKKVISCKATAWLLDPKMTEYLRPETLFGTKFESYLNACNLAPAVNSMEDLVDIQLSGEQSDTYLDYQNKMRADYPRLYSSVRMLKASEYFDLRPGSDRYERLRISYTGRQIGEIIAGTHKAIEAGLAQGRKYLDVATELNAALRQKA
jgi:uncharacterized phage protein (TIGR02220 family)